jgi:hypothetical protein
MNRQAVWAITRKDLATVLRNRGVRTPLLVPRSSSWWCSRC